jgi:hypothetical protein
VARSSALTLVPRFEDDGSTQQQQQQEGASAMRTQQQITKRTTRPVAAPLDLRTPTGRPLPF